MDKKTITREQLEKILTEEITKAISDGRITEGFLDRFKSQFAGNKAQTDQHGLGSTLKNFGKPTDTKQSHQAQTRLRQFEKDWEKLRTDMRGDLSKLGLMGKGGLGSNASARTANVPDNVKQAVDAWQQASEAMAGAIRDLNAVAPEMDSADAKPTQTKEPPNTKPATSKPDVSPAGKKDNIPSLDDLPDLSQSTSGWDPEDDLEPAKSPTVKDKVGQMKQAQAAQGSRDDKIKQKLAQLNADPTLVSQTTQIPNLQAKQVSPPNTNTADTQKQSDAWKAQKLANRGDRTNRQRRRMGIREEEESNE